MTPTPLDLSGASSISRRGFIAGAAALVPAAFSLSLPGCGAQEPIFRISLAEWSLHRALGAGELDNLDFPRVTREEYGIGAVEYVNSFFKDRAEDRAYLTELKTRCDDHGVTSVLIMCDGEGAIGNPDDAARTQARRARRPRERPLRHLL